MSAIQLLESIANNPEFKDQFLSGNISKEVQNKIQDTVDELGNIPLYCVFVPAEDDAPSDSDEDKKDKDDSENISVH